MRQHRKVGSRRIVALAERSLWALGLSLLAYWGWSQAAIRLQQARLEESFFSPAATAGRSGSDVAADAIGAADLTLRLDPGTPIGLLEISRVGVRAMVVEGVDNRSLKTAVGHIPGTALPGASGNAVLAAHRDTLFAGLRDVEMGDTITLRTGPRTYTYTVSGIDVVRPTAVEVMDPTPEPALTLITCFPFDFVGPAPMRYVIRAYQSEPAGGVRTVSAGAGSGESAGAATASGKRPLDPELLSFLSGSLVKPGAN